MYGLDCGLCTVHVNVNVGKQMVGTDFQQSFLTLYRQETHTGLLRTTCLQPVRTDSLFAIFSVKTRGEDHAKIWVMFMSINSRYISASSTKGWYL